jgi:hypothetical protein
MCPNPPIAHAERALLSPAIITFQFAAYPLAAAGHQE